MEQQNLVFYINRRSTGIGQNHSACIALKQIITENNCKSRFLVHHVSAGCYVMRLLTGVTLNICLRKRSIRWKWWLRKILYSNKLK